MKKLNFDFFESPYLKKHHSKLRPMVATSKNTKVCTIFGFSSKKNLSFMIICLLESDFKNKFLFCD